MRHHAPRTRIHWLLTLTLLASFGCGSAPARFPLRAARWTDDDRTPFSHRPASYWSPLVWDATDHTAFRPLSHALLVDLAGEAVDVNALDEVPDSSWYQNRLAVRALAPLEVAEGACAGRPPPAEGIWTITAGKRGGATPGFFATSPDGARYMIKIDDADHPEISSAADAIGSRFFWAAGFNTACYFVQRLDPSMLRIAAGATYPDTFGNARPFTAAHLASLVAGGAR
jgi:hypothetical protein